MTEINKFLKKEKMLTIDQKIPWSYFLEWKAAFPEIHFSPILNLPSNHQALERMIFQLVSQNRNVEVYSPQNKFTNTMRL